MWFAAFGVREWFAFVGGVCLLVVGVSYLFFPASPYLKADWLLRPGTNRRVGGAVYLAAALFCLAIAFGLLW